MIEKYTSDKRQNIPWSLSADYISSALLLRLAAPVFDGRRTMIRRDNALTTVTAQSSLRLLGQGNSEGIKFNTSEFSCNVSAYGLARFPS